MSDPTQLPAPEAELYSVAIQHDNALRVWLRLSDSAYLSVDFLPDSPFGHDLLELVERHMNETFRRLGQRGLRVTGFTPPEEDEDAP